MRHIKTVLRDYDTSSDADRKKIILIEWFQKYPGKRFDRSEVHQELGDDLGVGQGRIGQYLNELEDESVLVSRGDQRKAYHLSDDIMVPIKYQAIAGLRHISTLYDVERWGAIGVIIMTTTIWAFLTLPFWFFSIIVLISSSDRIGPLTETGILLFALTMTIWLIILIIISYLLNGVRRWWLRRAISD